MIVNRRHALRQFLFVSAGIALIPSCMQDKSKASVILKNFTIDGDQEMMLAELSETIIPATNSPGAKDISAHLFALKMLDDCYRKEDQQQFVKGMELFEKNCTTQFGSSFAKCKREQRNSFLQKIESNKNAKDDQQFFYNTVKRLTIQAYTSSKFYLTNINVYKLVPGKFHGCAPVKATA